MDLFGDPFAQIGQALGKRAYMRKAEFEQGQHEHESGPVDRYSPVQDPEVRAQGHLSGASYKRGPGGLILASKFSPSTVHESPTAAPQSQVN